MRKSTDNRGADAKLQELAKQVPWEQPDAARVADVRASLLAATNTDSPPHKPRWLAIGGGFLAGVLATAATLLAVLHGSSAPPPVAPAAVAARPAPATPVAPAATIAPVAAATRPAPAPPSAPSAAVVVKASSAADFERQPDETLRVRAGHLSISGPAGARVRVATGDAVVEGHGRYELVVDGDLLREVHVIGGDATVRLRDQQSIFLAAGETWKPSAIAAVVTPNRIARTRDVPPAPVEPARSASDVETHFETAWTSLRSGDNAAAAREFEIAAAARGNDALAADARYFEGVALVRAGRAGAAEAALRAYLDAAPHAARRGRAIVMLARLLAQRGDLAEARAWLASVATDPDPEVAAAARASLR